MDSRTNYLALVARGLPIDRQEAARLEAVGLVVPGGNAGHRLTSEGINAMHSGVHSSNDVRRYFAVHIEASYTRNGAARRGYLVYDTVNGDLAGFANSGIRNTLALKQAAEALTEGDQSAYYGRSGVACFSDKGTMTVISVLAHLNVRPLEYRNARGHEVQF